MTAIKLVFIPFLLVAPSTSLRLVDHIRQTPIAANQSDLEALEQAGALFESEDDDGEIEQLEANASANSSANASEAFFADEDLNVANASGEAPVDLWGEAPRVDLWIHVNYKAQTLQSNVFTPIISSMREAFDKLGAVSRTVDESFNDVMREGCRNSRKMKERPMVLIVAPHAANASSLRAFQDCKKNNAYLVYYNTEPWETNRVQNLARAIGVHELWDYAKANIKRYLKAYVETHPVRYVPPGYSARFDNSVSLYAPSREEKKVGFVGNFKFRAKRIIAMYRDVLGSELQESDQIWTKEDLHNYISKYPLQLNVHRFQSCCPHVNTMPVAMEAFRMTTLISNRACVVSTPVTAEDANLWKGIVHFAEVNETKKVLDKLRSEDIRKCQYQAGRLYRSRFDPLKILNESGLFNDWIPPSLTSEKVHEGLVNNLDESMVKKIAIQKKMEQAQKAAEEAQKAAESADVSMVTARASGNATVIINASLVDIVNASDDELAEFMIEDFRHRAEELEEEDYHAAADDLARMKAAARREHAAKIALREQQE